MKAEICPYKPETEFFIGEQCYITELSNSDNDSAVSIARARVLPGVSTHWHRLEGIVERYVIVEGQGLAEVGDLCQPVGPGDVVLIPAGCPQRITNRGGHDLVFLAICTPRFVSTAYVDMQGG